MKRILFSCLGTSDPVRGTHDGPMLHILRHYRPEKVVAFLTPEIADYEAQDHRFEKARQWINEHWGGYAPDFRFITLDVKNVHDIDALDQPLCEAMAQLSREEPEAEILVNVSSGTPQMQMVLSQLAMDTRYRTKGVQVSNFEKKSGQSQRTNDKQYDIDSELFCNEDELPDAENRCVEPAMYAVQREYQRRQITALLDERNFEAVEELRDSLPEKLRKLALHLAARNRLQTAEAERLSSGLSELPFPLYAYKTGSRTEYKPVLEYYLRMKNLAAVGDCTAFLLHLEPLTLRLQLALLDKLLRPACKTADFVIPNGNRLFFEPDRLQAVSPALYQHYERNVRELRSGDINTYVCDRLLSFFPSAPEKPMQLFARYGQLKELRNGLAHTLKAITEKEVKASCGLGTAELLRLIEATLIECYPACDPAIFSVYDKCIRFIKDNL